MQSQIPLGTCFSAHWMAIHGNNFLSRTQLIYFIMLIIIETFRLKDRRRIHGYENLSVRHKTKVSRLKKALISTVLAGVLFSGYGAIRNFYSAPEQKLEMDAFESITLEVKRFLHGEGLIGLTWILQSFPEQPKYLGGKTIIGHAPSSYPACSVHPSPERMGSPTSLEAWAGRIQLKMR